MSSTSPEWLTEGSLPNDASTDPGWLAESNAVATATPKKNVQGSGSITSSGTSKPPVPFNLDPVNTGGDNNTSATQAAQKKTWGEYFRDTFKRDGRLLLITLAILICMNLPFIRWALYPFIIFSTWIHEMCHAMAAVITGAKVLKLEVFPDTSGLAYVEYTRRYGFVSSAGYQGTAFIGFLLLIFRRTKRGPRTGTMVLGLTMIISVIVWVRNAFGIIFILAMGLTFVGLAWFLPSTHIRNLYVIIAVTCSLNAIAFAGYLFGLGHNVNGNMVQSDAHAMAEIKGGSYVLWALLWLLLSLAFTTMGFLFAVPGPDEVADFQCCGICQDFGCFKPCNYPGQRSFSRFIGRNSTPTATSNTAGDANV